MKRLVTGIILPLIFLVVPAQAVAQSEASEPLDGFVQQVARLWAGSEAASLARLAPSSGRILLELDGESGTVEARHAAAAFRALFDDRQSVSIRATRVSSAGGTPPRGFGEISWTFRSRGVSDPQTETVYVGAVWEGRGWRIAELRIIP